MDNTAVFENSAPLLSCGSSPTSTTDRNLLLVGDPATTLDPAATTSPSLKPQQPHGGITQGNNADQNVSPLQSRRPSWEIPDNETNKRLSASGHTSFFSMSPKVHLGRKSQHRSVGDERQQQKQQKSSQVTTLPTSNKQNGGTLRFKTFLVSCPTAKP